MDAATSSCDNVPWQSMATEFAAEFGATLPLFYWALLARHGKSRHTAFIAFKCIVFFACVCRVRLLVSAEATPFELFENILTQAEAHAVDTLATATGIEPAVDDQLGFSKDR